MDIDFDNLLNYCIKLNNSSSEKCLICHIPIEQNDSHLKLNCNHLFHVNCLGYKKGIINCMYCEKSSMPIIINSTQTINNQTDILCKVILKSGPSKGNFCNRIKCKYHKI